MGATLLVGLPLVKRPVWALRQFSLSPARYQKPDYRRAFMVYGVVLVI